MGGYGNFLLHLGQPEADSNRVSVRSADCGRLSRFFKGLRFYRNYIISGWKFREFELPRFISESLEFLLGGLFYRFHFCARDGFAGRVLDNPAQDPRVSLLGRHQQAPEHK